MRFLGRSQNGLGGFFRMDLRMGKSGTLTWGALLVGVAAYIHDGMTSRGMHTCTATWLHTPLLTAD
jgi:hypothetical protein